MFLIFFLSWWKKHTHSWTVNETSLFLSTDSIGAQGLGHGENFSYIYRTLGKAINHNVTLNRVKNLFITCFCFIFLLILISFPLYAIAPFTIHSRCVLVLKFAIVNLISLNKCFYFMGGSVKIFLSFTQHIDFKLLMLCQRDTFLCCHFPGFLVIPHSKHVLLLTGGMEVRKSNGDAVLQFACFVPLFCSLC